ncbi:MAG TPA: DUF4384 domain-containing protein [Xanthomonadaceae bacterium]|nr:DUF4384 domain-containing protein [Xanthomonadaceae bacterium]
MSPVREPRDGRASPTAFSTTGFITMPRNPAIILSFIALLLAGCAATPPTPTAAPTVDSLRLANPRAPFAVTLRAEHGPPRIGVPVQLSLRAATDGYLNLYFINSAGNTGQLLTNYPVRANEMVFFPPTASKRLEYTPAPPTGVETFILVTTHRPLNLFGRYDIKNVKRPRTPVAEFNLTGQQFVNRLRGAMRQWPPQAWNAASIQVPSLPPTGRS